MDCKAVISSCCNSSAESMRTIFFILFYFSFGIGPSLGATFEKRMNPVALEGQRTTANEDTWEEERPNGTSATQVSMADICNSRIVCAEKPKKKTISFCAVIYSLRNVPDSPSWWQEARQSPERGNPNLNCYISQSHTITIFAKSILLRHPEINNNLM